MNCPYCGARLNSGAKFCEECGGRVESSPPAQPEVVSEYRAGDAVRLVPGYSRRVDSERMRAALKKQRRTTRIAAACLVAAPLIIMPIYGAVSSSMEIWSAILYGVIVSIIVALVTLYMSLKRMLSKPFEGTVVDKKHSRRYGRAARRSPGSRNIWRIRIDCDDGKHRKKDVSATVYNYLQVGDRVRYLPQFPQPFEKYDKSRDAEIPCMFCGIMNSVENDSCTGCHNPLLK